MGVNGCTSGIITKSVSAVHIFAGGSVPKVKSQVGICLGNRGECNFGCFFGREGRYGKSYNEEQNGAPQPKELSPEKERMLDAIQAEEDKTQDKLGDKKRGVIIPGKKNW